MRSLISAILVSLAGIVPAAQQPPPPVLPMVSLTDKRSVLQSEVAITTLTAEEIHRLPAVPPVDHDSEVSRTERVHVVVMVQGCEKNEQGACTATAEVVAYKPDGAVHTQLKDLSLSGGRAVASLPLAATDETGIYRVVATVRDLTARRFAQTERLFGVK
ncbi:MAG: hypothetical protein ACT4QD_14835 [Acidobacteriota bacterium]